MPGCRTRPPVGRSKVKLTGGEPLLYRWDRATVTDLVRDMCALRQDLGFDLSMTTNGSLLPTMAHELKRAGLDRVTVSLTTLNPHTFTGLIAPNPRLLKQSMRGLQAARDAGLDPVKINMVLYQSHRRNIGNLDEIKTVTDLAVGRSGSS